VRGTLSSFVGAPGDRNDRAWCGHAIGGFAVFARRGVGPRYVDVRRLYCALRRESSARAAGSIL
jgi:hypothetical protein